MSARAMLSFGDGLSAARSLAYLRIIEATPLRENAWEQVALAEATEIVAQAEPNLPPTCNLYVCGLHERASYMAPSMAATDALAEALAEFLTMEVPA